VIAKIMANELTDYGRVKGRSNVKQRSTVAKHVANFFLTYPEVINYKNSLDNCTADDLDDGIIGKFADWILKDKNTKVSKYNAHDQYVSQFKTLLEETPRFRQKVGEWMPYYSRVRYDQF
jgi:hypothetical protein